MSPSHGEDGCGQLIRRCEAVFLIVSLESSIDFPDCLDSTSEKPKMDRGNVLVPFLDQIWASEKTFGYLGTGETDFESMISRSR